MAKINRYTQTSQARFNPMSLEEAMLVPAYKRQQHDTMSDSIASAETELAKVNPLDLHSEVAQKEQKRLYDQLTSKSDLLAEEGFTNTTKSDILRLNKDYQSSLGPTGVLGKATAARESLTKERDTYIANATKLGYSPEAAGENWKDHVALYGEKFAKEGKINNIDSLYAPEYRNAVGELRTLLKEAGMTASDISNIKSHIVMDPTSGSYVLTKKGRTGASNNITQLKAAVDYMNNQVKNPNSSIGKSLKHGRKTPDSVLDELSGLGDIYAKSTFTKETGSQISSFHPLKNDSNGITATGSGLTVASSQYAPAKFSGTTYGEIEDSIQDLIITGEDQGGLNSEQQSTLLEMQDFQKAIDVELENNEEYLETKRLYLQALKTEENMRKGNHNYESEFPESQTSENRQIIKTVNSLKNQLSDISEPFVKFARLKVTEYAITPLTSKQRTAYNIINENADRLLRISPQSLEQLGDIKEIIDPNGEPKAITNEADKQGLANLIFQSKEGSVQVVSHVARGSSGKPEVVFRIETTDDNTYDLEGIAGARRAPTEDNKFNINQEGYTGDVGGGKPLQIRLSFDTTNNEVGVNNLLGLLQNYTSSTGPVGEQFVNSQKINIIKSKYGGQTWNEIITSGALENNPIIVQIWKEELKALGIRKESSNEEKKAAIDKLKRIRLRR